MKLSNDRLIKKWEVYEVNGRYPPVRQAYLPTAHDVPTIGWGHTKGVYMGQIITLEGAQAMFEEDVAWYKDPSGPPRTI